MPRVPLTAETLNQLSDGYAAKAINSALVLINKDIDDRGNDGKPRTLTVTYTLKPTGSDRVEIDVKTNTKMPAYQPPKTVAKMDTAAGGLVFHTESSGNPDQLTLSDLDDEGDDDDRR